jgi:HEAT repeat protein
MSELEEHIRKLDSTGEAERIYAAEDIGYANRAEGVPPLLERLPAESSRAVREAIFAALQSIEDDAVIEGAIRLLAREDSFLRNQAVDLLRHRGPRVISSLSRAFSRANRDERKLILDVLASVDGPGASGIYDRALADGDVNVVITAVESLGNARKAEFRGRIEELTAAGHPMLAGACLETLAQIGNSHSLEVVRSRAGAGSHVADFLLPSYLKLLGVLGGEQELAETAGMLLSRGAHLQASILDAMTMLRRRHASAPLPESLVEPLQSIVRNGNSPIVRRQALRLLEGLTRLDGVAAFLAAWRSMDEDTAGRRESHGV